METQSNSTHLTSTEAEPRLLPDRSNGVCALVSDKWTVQVIWQLSLASDRRLRFSALKRRMEGITQRMLTLTLRSLERDGFVTRHYFAEVPPRVEYELTGLGVGILQPLTCLNAWIRENLSQIEECRRAYDDLEH